MNEIDTAQPDIAPKSKSRRIITPAVRKHQVANINRNQLAGVLDAYAAEGRIVVALNISRDIGGSYEVVSYTER